jgi:hypothetical protein
MGFHITLNVLSKNVSPKPTVCRVKLRTCSKPMLVHVNMSAILALLAIIFRRYLLYITLINTAVELHEMRSLELTQSLVGRLFHLGIEKIWFKVLSMWSGWGCTWQDAWSHALQILFFKIPTQPFDFHGLHYQNPTKLPTLFKIFSP